MWTTSWSGISSKRGFTFCVKKLRSSLPTDRTRSRPKLTGRAQFVRAPRAARTNAEQVVYFCVPVLDVGDVGPGRGHKRDVLRAWNPVRGDPLHALAARPRCPVMAVNEVVLTGSDLGKDHRARQVGCAHRQFVHVRAGPCVGHVTDRDEFTPERCCSANVIQQAGDIELEDPVGVELISLPCLARSKERINSEPRRYGVRAG
jgi:hypothetical protein